MEEQVMPATKCDSCKNKDICKFVEDMTNAQIGIYNIKMPTKSPITIDAECSTYERKLQKQDGILYR